MLSHSFRTHITTGYAKGTPTSDMVKCIKHLQACAPQILHPLLLPVIILGHNLSSKTDQKQREARDWLCNLEYATSMCTVLMESKYVRDAMVDLDQISCDLVECHAQVLSTSPQAWQGITKGIYSAMDGFWGQTRYNPAYGGPGGEVDKLHRSMLARIEFYNSKIKGIENYASITLERLKVQRAAVGCPVGPSSLIPPFTPSVL